MRVEEGDEGFNVDVVECLICSEIFILVPYPEDLIWEVRRRGGVN